MSERREILLLGVNHPSYGVGEVETRAQRGSETVVALTVGSDPLSPSRLHKASSEIPNEDGLLVVDEGARTVLAVADGHHGHEASHTVLERLELGTRRGLPANPLELLVMIRNCGGEAPEIEYPAMTSLLVAVWDRESGEGFGASFADSSLVVLSGAGEVRAAQGWDQVACNQRNAEFVTPLEPASLDPRRAREFVFRAGPGDLVLAFTDGVDGCHYGHPKSSVLPVHYQSLWTDADGDVERFVDAAVELALTGVVGQPGGQDNLAMVACCARS